MHDGEHIHTYTGIEFYIIDPQEEDIDIHDIAHPLSLLCRANGHCRYFYSVAQHTLNCAREAAGRGHSRRVQLGCLLHDGSEAYIADITRPTKKYLTRYLEIEKAIQDTIFKKYGLGDLSDEERRQIFEIDDHMLYHEFWALNETLLSDSLPALSSTPDFSMRPMDEVEQEYLNTFYRLYNQTI